MLAGEPRLTAQSVLRSYDLGISANAVRVKGALQALEIIDVAGSAVQILDPVFAHWLRRDYFRLRQ